MAWDLPVCVNMHEATAFATWKSHKNGSHYRVLSELEHHAIRNESQQLSGPSGSVDMVLKSLQNVRKHLDY
jgi:formylglycine-generating enzyme required for sulfatase activity